MELFIGLNKLWDTIRYTFITMRPKQWIKNGFIFAGLIFSRSFFDMELVKKAVYAFILFSLVSGCVYILNDIIDRERDLLHPEKSKRPIASGRLKPGAAIAACVGILIPTLLVSANINIRLFGILMGYFMLVMAYSIKLKQIAILDVILIASGFVLRTVGGAVAIDVFISPWLIVCTTMLALFLALNKRRNELFVLEADAATHRKNLQEYTPELIDRMLSVITSTTVVSYALYTFNAGKSYYMMLTIPFVLYGIFRYQMLVLNKDMGGSPEIVLFKDKPLLINIILWVITSIVIVTNYY